MDKNFKKIYIILALLDLKNDLHLDPDQKRIRIKIDLKIWIQIPNDLARRIWIWKNSFVSATQVKKIIYLKILHGSDLDPSKLLV